MDIYAAFKQITRQDIENCAPVQPQEIFEAGSYSDATQQKPGSLVVPLESLPQEKQAEYFNVRYTKFLF